MCSEQCPSAAQCLDLLRDREGRRHPRPLRGCWSTKLGAFQLLTTAKTVDWTFPLRKPFGGLGAPMETIGERSDGFERVQKSP